MLVQKRILTRTHYSLDVLAGVLELETPKESSFLAKRLREVIGVRGKSTKSNSPLARHGREANDLFLLESSR